MRAERKAGDLLAEMERYPQGGDHAKLQAATSLPKLADLGVSKKASHRYQTIAKLPAEDFEAIITDTIEKGDELTTPRCTEPLAGYVTSAAPR